MWAKGREYLSDNFRLCLKSISYLNNFLKNKIYKLIHGVAFLSNSATYTRITLPNGTASI
jgi:hypothetical protein